MAHADAAALQFGGEWRHSEGRYQYRDEAEFDLVFDIPGALAETSRAHDIDHRASGEQVGAYASLRTEVSAQLTLEGAPAKFGICSVIGGAGSEVIRVWDRPRALRAEDVLELDDDDARRDRGQCLPDPVVDAVEIERQQVDLPLVEAIPRYDGGS